MKRAQLNHNSAKISLEQTTSRMRILSTDHGFCLACLSHTLELDNGIRVAKVAAAFPMRVRSVKLTLHNRRNCTSGASVSNRVVHDLGWRSHCATKLEFGVEAAFRRLSCVLLLTLISQASEQILVPHHGVASPREAAPADTFRDVGTTQEDAPTSLAASCLPSSLSVWEPSGTAFALLMVCGATGQEMGFSWSSSVKSET